MSQAGASAVGADSLHDGLLRVLENDRLRVVIAPALGGKIVSLCSKRTATEWLLPSLRPHSEARADAGFEAWDGGGFDECLPTVAATENAPDHGEVWRSPWQQVEAEGMVVLLRTTALSGALAFERRAWLEGPTLALDYRVTNASPTRQSLLYSAHPLLQVQQGDRILLPSKVAKVRVEGSGGARLGSRGDTVGWPRTASGEDLGLVGPPDGRQADKLFAGPLTDGWCALVRAAADEGIELSFPPDVLPYLGLWICRAAWPDSGTKKQYTVALEPASAPCDSLADAEREGTAWVLQPGEDRAWTLRIRLLTPQDIHERTAQERE